MDQRRHVPKRSAPPVTRDTSTLDLEFAELSDLGGLRTNNEDYLGHLAPDSPAKARSHGWFFVLADGVGGHRQGEVAARTAVEAVIEGFASAPPSEPAANLLTRLVKDANTRVHETGIAAGPAGAGMSTTIVACNVRFDRVYVAHVGDSRCYLIRDGRIKPLTRDHTIANEQVRIGVLAPGELGGNNRHLLSRSLGGELFVNVEVNDFAVRPGDMLLLCSDGLHGAVPDGKIAEAVTNGANLTLAMRQLINLANGLDGGDNVSVQLIQVRSIERMGVYRGRPYKLR